MARSSEEAPPGERRRCSEGHEVKSRREPTGKKPRGVERGCVWGLEARPGLGARRRGRGPRLRPVSGGTPGPASRRRLTSRPSRRPGPRAGLEAAPAGPHVRGFGLRSQRRPPLPQALRFGSGPRDPFPPGPAAPPTTRRLYLLRERVEGVEAGAASSSARRGAAGPQPFSRRRHCALRRRARLASRGGRRGGRGDCWGGGGDARRVPGGETLPLSVRPGKSSLAAASRERAGGRPNGEGSREVGNGCHVVQVARRPPPPPHPPAPRRDLWFVPELRHGAGPPRGAGSGDRARGRSRLSRSFRRASPGLADSAASDLYFHHYHQKLPRNPVFPPPSWNGHREEQALFNVWSFRGRRELF